jgi:cyclophilin family peptidyl-prolyl cis-trans isomerase
MDGRYPAFGRVTQGMDVVRTIEQQPVKGSKNAPVQRITIDAAGELSL